MNRLAWEMGPVATEGLERGLQPASVTGNDASLKRPEGRAPTEAKDLPVAFRLPAAMGFVSQPSGKFSLRINDQPMFDFNVSLNDASWRSTDGRVRMNYTVMEVNGEDSCGVLEFEFAPGLVKKGEAARFEVTGSGAGSQRWFGIYLLPEQP